MNSTLSGGGIKRRKIFSHIFKEIISLENLFLAWQEFRFGKKNRIDVQEFECNLEDNIFQLHQELKTKTYQHLNYQSFYIRDPKLRCIHKACVKDRVLHHAVFRILYPIFDTGFIYDSYSCRIAKGAHRAINRLRKFAGKVSKRNNKNCFILKCDIKKFFDSVNQDVLISLIEKKVKDQETIWLIKKIVKSFFVSLNTGLPLGNITSQLFANIYLNGLDQFIKHELKVKYYIRYCDDLVILSDSRRNLENLIPQIDCFLEQKLKLHFHRDKIIIKKYRQGIDFLGYVVFPFFRLVRAKTQRRIFRKLHKRVWEYKQGLITEQALVQSLDSYLGVFSHANAYKITSKLGNRFWSCLSE